MAKRKESFQINSRKVKEAYRRPAPIFPSLSSEQLLALSRAEFQAVAKKANMKPTALLRILRKDMQRQSLARKARLEAPEPVFEAPPEERLMMATVEYVFSDLDFMKGPVSLALIDPMREVVENEYLRKKVQRKDRDDLDRVIRNDKAMKEFRRIYLLEAFAQAHLQGGDTYDVFALASKAKEWLTTKRERTNDPIDQTALLSALKVVDELSKKKIEYQHWFGLYMKYITNHAYRNKTLDYETRYKILRLFNDVRARSRTGASPYVKWMAVGIDDMVDIMAANYLRLRDVYISTWEGYTDRRDATGAAEWHAGGLGGQFSYDFSRKSRPHRDDNGNYGERD